MISRRTNRIETLLEWLESLQITNKALSYNEWIDIEMSGTPVLANENIQAMMPKSIVPDPG